MTYPPPENKLDLDLNNEITAAGGVDVNTDANAESDYGSDFTPDEEEVLNALLLKVAGGGDSQPTAKTREEKEKEEEGSAAGAAAAGAGEGGVKEAVPVPDPGAAVVVTDIEDYERVWRSPRPTKVLGRLENGWEAVQQQRLRQRSGSPGAGERPGSLEGRDRDRERQRERNGSVPLGDPENTPAPDSRIPVERFRRAPMKALSVTDLISPAWCELQYWYSLTKHGRKRRTAAMKQGSAVHKTLEDQVHTTVPVDVTTKEDAWGLRIWNVIQGLRTLRETGMTRELEIWGVIDGEVVNGVIDQLSYECPDPEMETSAEEHYSNAAEARQTLPEYQASITDYLLSPSRSGRRISDLADSKNAGAAAAAESKKMSSMSEKKIYMTDIKTRGSLSRSIPTVSSAAFRPTQLQLHIYYHLLNRLATTDEITMETVASRYELDPNQPFSDMFIAEVGGLNDQFYDVLSSQGSGASSYQLSSHNASQDSTSILLSHNNLSHLWSLMKTHLYLTFVRQQDPSAPPLPSEEQAQQPKPPHRPQPFKPPTLLSPLLTATYLSPPTTEFPHSEHLGSRSFLFDPAVLTSHLRDVMSWWLGKRPPRGVEVMEAWKCRLCEFRDECTWREEREEEMAESRRAKREALEAGGGKS